MQNAFQLTIVLFILLITFGLTAAPVSANSSYFTETDRSANGTLTSGETDSIFIDGNRKPKNASLNITGHEQSISEEASGTTSGSFTVGGTKSPTSETLTADYSFDSGTQEISPMTDNYDSSELSGKLINGIDISANDPWTYNYGDAKVYVQVDGDPIYTGNVEGETSHTASFASTYVNNNVNIYMIADSGYFEGSIDYLIDNGASVTIDGQTYNFDNGGGFASISLSNGQSYSVSASGNSVSWDVSWTENYEPEDIVIETNTDSFSIPGSLGPTESINETVSLETGTEQISATYSGSTAPLSYDLKWTEVNLAPEGEPSINATSPINNSLITDEVQLNATISSPVINELGNITVDFYTSNDQKIGSASRTGNGTVSIIYTDPLAGQNGWYAQINGLGNATTETKYFETPSNLEIRSETDPSQLITTTNNTTVRFFAQSSDRVYTRQTQDGKAQMLGLPANEAFIAVVDAEGYRNRRVLINSLLQTQTAYLLENNKEIVEPAFRLTDFTNDYPTQDTVLLIERNFGNGWKNVEGDYFGGSNKVSAQLQYNTRYRLTVKNIETGDTYDLGSYTPTASNIIDLEVFNTGGETTITQAPSLDISPTQYRLSSADESEFTFDVAENDMNLESYTIRAIRDDGFVIDSTGGSSPGTDSLVLNTTKYEMREIRIEYTWKAGGTERTVNATTFLIARSFENEGAIVPVLMDVGESDPSTPPGPTQSMIALVGALAGTGFAARRLSSGAAGLVGLGVLGIATLIGFFATTWLFAAAITWLVLSGLQKRV